MEESAVIRVLRRGIAFPANVRGNRSDASGKDSEQIDSVNLSMLTSHSGDEFSLFLLRPALSQWSAIGLRCDGYPHVLLRARAVVDGT